METNAILHKERHGLNTILMFKNPVNDPNKYIGKGRFVVGNMAFDDIELARCQVCNDYQCHGGC